MNFAAPPAPLPLNLIVPDDDASQSSDVVEEFCSLISFDFITPDMFTFPLSNEKFIFGRFAFPPSTNKYFLVSMSIITSSVNEPPKEPSSFLDTFVKFSLSQFLPSFRVAVKFQKL